MSFPKECEFCKQVMNNPTDEIGHWYGCIHPDLKFDDLSQEARESIK